MADETLTYAMKFDIGDATASLANAQQRVAELHQVWEGLSDAERAAIEDFTAAKDALKLQAEAAGLTVGELTRLRGALEGAAEAERQATEATKAATAAEQDRLAAASKRAAALKGVSAEEVTAAKVIRDQRDALTTQAEALGISTVELGKMRKGLDLTGKSINRSGKSMADISNRAKILRAQFADIGTTLVGGMNPFVVLAQQGPDVAFALGDMATAGDVLTKTFGRLIALTGPIAMGLAGIVTIYTWYKIESDKANETANAMSASLERLQGEADKTAKALDRAKGSWESFSGLRTSLEQRLDVLTGMRSQTEVDRANLTAQIEAETMPTIKALGQRVAQTEAQLAIKREQLKEVTSRTQAEAIESEIRSLEMLSRHTEKRLQQAQEQRQEALYLVDAVADAEIAEEARTKAAKETTKAYKKQTKELDSAAREALRLEAARTKELEKQNAILLARAQEGLSSLTGAEQTIQGASSEAVARASAAVGFNPEDIARMVSEAGTPDKLADVAGTVQIFIDALDRATKGIADEDKAREANTQQLIDQARAEAVRRRETAQTAISALGSGDPTALIASAGPQGALIAEVTKMLKAFGEAEEGATPIDMLGEFVDLVTEGLAVLPEALAEALPDILTESIPALIIGLADGLVSLVDTAVPAILGSLDELIEVLIKEVGPALLTFKGDIAAAFVTAVVPALLDALKAIGTLLVDPQFWQDTGNSIRERVGTMLGNAFKGGQDLRARAGEALGSLATAVTEALKSALTKDFWLEVLKGLIDAVRDFSLSDVSTPGLDAFRTAAGVEEGTRSGIASRARGVAEGARTRIQNISVSGAVGDPRSLRRFLRNASLRRDGVGSIG